MTKKLLFLLRTVPVIVTAMLLFGLSLPAVANPDQDCMNTCVAQGQAEMDPGLQQHVQTDCMQRCGILNIDYRCLSACIGQGSTAYSCRQSCVYVKAGALATQGPPRSNPHSQFTTLFPTNANQPLPTAPATSSAANPQPSTNYQCVAQCLQPGFTYGYCRQSCTH